MGLTFQEFQPYLTAFSAALSATTLGFILNFVKAVRDNAQDRIAIQDERLKLAAEDHQRIEKWADREKSTLKDELDKTKTELDKLLTGQGIDLSNLALGKKLSESAESVRETAVLVKGMQQKIARLSELRDGAEVAANPDWELSLAMAAMAYGSFADAAEHFDSYSRTDGTSWQANFTRGVAHANARGGPNSNLASLRAYNDAIALAPSMLEPNQKARMFAYRGAILKRLGRFPEAESDLKIALSLANAQYEIADIHYNLSCVFALQNDKLKMLEELNELKGNRRFLSAVASHTEDYFQNFRDDPDFKAMFVA